MNRRRLSLWLARYVQRPTLWAVRSQPLLRTLFTVQSALTHRPLRGTRQHHATLTSEGASVAVTWLQPPGPTDRGVVLYLHGGGFTIGSTRTHAGLISHLALAAEATALSVEYRLAPEHPFPAAIDDALTAYRTLVRQGTRGGTIAIAGDSAGGCLAVQLCQRIDAEGLPPPAALALMSPLLDLTFSGDSITRNQGRDPLIPIAWGKRAIGHYLAGHPGDDPAVSPLLGDLSGLPPTIIHVADTEMLLDDSTRLAARLTEHGIETVITVHKSLAHVWQMNAGWLPEADDSLATLGKFLGAHLQGREE